MNARAIAKGIKTSATLPGVRCLALWEEPTDVAYAEYEGVPILPLAVAEIGRRETARLVAPVRSWGWVVTLPVTRRIGAVAYVPRSKRARRSVQFGLGFSKPKVRVMLRKRLVTYARS